MNTQTAGMRGTRVTVARPSHERVQSASSSRGSAGGLLAVALVAFMAVAPLPLGGNRPLFWGLGAAIVAIIALLYAWAMSRADRRFRLPLSRFPDLALPFALMLAWLVAQLLPLGLLGWHRTISGATGVTLTTGTISLDPGPTGLMLVQMAGYGLLGFLAAQAGARHRRGAMVMTALFWIVVAYAGIGLVSLVQLGDTILGVRKWTYLGSATGTFVNRNSFATFLSFGLSLGLAIVLDVLGRPENRERRRRTGLTEALLTIAGLIFILAALLASQSRMGLFAGLCGALIVLAVGTLRIGRPRWLLLGGVAALPILVGLVLLYGGGLLERLGGLNSDADVRGALYPQVWRMIATAPWLGYGGGGFASVFPLFHQLPVSADVVWDRAHSTYLALWVELGLVAGSLPLLVVAFAGLRLVIAVVRNSAPARIVLAGLGVITVAAVHSLVDFSLEIQAVAQLFVLVLGVAVGAATSARRPAEAVEPAATLENRIKARLDA